MKEHLTRKNIGLGLAILLALPLIPSIFGKLTKMDEVIATLSTNNMQDWITIIGIGELVSLVLFLIPKTMRLGALLLSAYFGGAILFHMGNTVPEQQTFYGPTFFLLAVWVIAWVRGMDIFQTNTIQ